MSKMNCAVNATVRSSSAFSLNKPWSVLLTEISNLSNSVSYSSTTEACSQLPRLQFFVYATRLTPEQEKLLSHTCRCLLRWRSSTCTCHYMLEVSPARSKVLLEKLTGRQLAKRFVTWRPVYIVNQINPLHITLFYFYKFHSNIILLSNLNSVHISHLFHVICSYK